MVELDILARTLLALSFGAILGLETETRSNVEAKEDSKKLKELLKQRIGGVRTYTVLSLFGALAGMLFSAGYPIFSYLMFGAVFFVILAAYIMNIQYNKAFGMTTEIAILITVLVGFAATAGIISLHILVIIIVLLAFILSQKRGIAVVTRKIAHQELQDVVKFAIVAMVIFPFLPDQDFFINDVGGLNEVLLTLGINSSALESIVLVNPFKLWRYVVLISGFNLLGYFANRVFGKAQGLLLTGIFGGFVSSTSTMVALAVRSKSEQAKYMWRNLGGVGLIANAVSFAQLLVLAASASILFFSAVVPMAVAMAVGSIGVALWFMTRNTKDLDKNVELEYEPYSIGPAVKFALMLTTVRLLVQVVNYYAGDSAFLLVTAMSGILGMDLATITLGELVGQGEITLSLAAFTFLVTNAANFGAKSFYGYTQGSVNYFKVVSIGLGVALLAGFFGWVSILASV